MINKALKDVYHFGFSFFLIHSPIFYVSVKLKNLGEFEDLGSSTTVEVTGASSWSR